MLAKARMLIFIAMAFLLSGCVDKVNPPQFNAVLQANYHFKHDYFLVTNSLGDDELIQPPNDCYQDPITWPPCVKKYLTDVNSQKNTQWRGLFPNIQQIIGLVRAGDTYQYTKLRWPGELTDSSPTADIIVTSGRAKGKTLHYLHNFGEVAFYRKVNFDQSGRVQSVTLRNNTVVPYP